MMGKLTEEKVIKLRKDYPFDVKQRAKELGVAPATLYNALSGRTWEHVDWQVPPPTKKRKFFFKPDWAVDQCGRFDRGGMIEDICKCGVGHPNTEWMKRYAKNDKGIHGCCGCCSDGGLFDNV